MTNWSSYENLHQALHPDPRTTLSSLAMRDRYKIILLFLISILTYLPSLRSGYFVLDDMSIVETVMKNPWVSLTDLFQFKKGTYYRGMTGLSYHIDAWLWGMKPAFMHLHNILIHAFNACLVFLIAKQLLAYKRVNRSYLPFFAASLFIIHPINTESINWISGRSDPLATLFALSAASLFFLALQNKRLWPHVLSALLLLAGSLAKEPAFALFPGFILSLLFIKPERTDLRQREFRKISKFSACLPYVAGAFSYGYLRWSSYKSNIDIGTNMIVETIVEKQSLWIKIETMVAALGFYLKKLLIPFPQSIAIDTINPHYFWLGLVALIITLACILKRNIFSAIILFIILPIGPALLVAVIKFAFLPSYAERYLYMSSAFLAIGLALLATTTMFRKPVSFLLLLLLITYLPASIQRTLLWSDHLKLLESVNVQELEDASYWNAYCIVLAQREHYQEARNEYRKLLQKHPLDQTAYSNLARMELYLNDPLSAREALSTFFNDKSEPGLDLSKTMLEVAQALLEQSSHNDAQNNARKDLITANLKIFDFTKDPHSLLTAAEHALVLKDYPLVENLTQELINKHQNNDIIMAGVSRILSVLDDSKP